MVPGGVPATLWSREGMQGTSKERGPGAGWSGADQVLACSPLDGAVPARAPRPPVGWGPLALGQGWETAEECAASCLENASLGVLCD